MAVVLLTVLVVAGAAALWSPSRVQSSASPLKAIPVTFTDIREAAGITFLHEATMTPEKRCV